MTVTVLDLLSRLPNYATEHRSELVSQENPIVTIITDVSRDLSPFVDFELNGKVLISDTFNNVVRKYGSTAVEELCDFSKRNLKLAWSPEIIDPENENAIFHLNLCLRVLSFDVATGTVNFVALRNKYGSSTVQLTHQFQK